MMRFIQALGGSVGSVGAMAMVRDFFSVDESARIYSLLMLVLSASPLLAPSVGSFVVAHDNWSTIFYILAFVGALNIAMTFFFLPEGHQPDPSIRLNLGGILSTFKDVLFNRVFFVYTMAGSFSFAGLFVYVAGSPSIFMGAFRVSAQVYGMIFALLAVGMIGGTQLNLLLTRRFSSAKIFYGALIAEVIVGLVFFTGSWLGLWNLWTTVALLFAVLSAAGISYPNAIALALAPFSKNTGSASAMVGFLQLSIGSVISACVGLFKASGSLPTAATIAFSSLVALIIVILGQRALRTETRAEGTTA